MEETEALTKTAIPLGAKNRASSGGWVSLYPQEVSRLADGDPEIVCTSTRASGYGSTEKLLYQGVDRNLEVTPVAPTALL